MHRILSDAWSVFIFCQELAELYDAAASGRPAQLAQLPIEYADFGQRQRHWLSGPVLQQQSAHLRTHLSGDIPKLQLPTDRPGSTATHHRGAVQTLAVSGPVFQTKATDRHMAALSSRPSHDRASPSLVCDALRFLSFPTPCPRQQPSIRPVSPYILICPKYPVYFPSSFGHVINVVILWDDFMT